RREDLQQDAETDPDFPQPEDGLLQGLEIGCPNRAEEGLTVHRLDGGDAPDRIDVIAFVTGMGRHHFALSADDILLKILYDAEDDRDHDQAAQGNRPAVNEQ